MSDTPMIDKMLENYRNLVKGAEQKIISEFVEDLNFALDERIAFHGGKEGIDLDTMKELIKKWEDKQ